MRFCLHFDGKRVFVTETNGDLGEHHPGSGAEAGGPAALVPPPGAEGGAGLPHSQPQVGDSGPQHEDESLDREANASETFEEPRYHIPGKKNI